MNPGRTLELGLCVCEGPVYNQLPPPRAAALQICLSQLPSQGSGASQPCAGEGNVHEQVETENMDRETKIAHMDAESFMSSSTQPSGAGDAPTPHPWGLQ